MKKILLLAVFFIIQLLGLKALAHDNRLFCTPIITTGTISPGTICAGTIISVPYTFTDCVDPSNVFTAQLSDATGSFASPTNIGSAAGTIAGFILAIIPPNITFGSGYRIRVISSSPSTIGNDNGVDLVLLPKPNATFNINNATQCVNGNNFICTNTSTGSISSYNWNLGDGITTSLVNVNYIYASSGSYNVVLTAIGTNGCRDSAVKTVIVQAKPVANFSFTGTDLCSSTVFNFVNTTPGTTSASWSFSDGDTSTLQNPSHTFAAAGSYSVKLLVQNGSNCKDSITKPISVLDKPTASFLVNNTTQCLGGNSFGFPNFSTGVGNTYLWSFGDGSTSNAINATKTFAVAGVYVVKLLVTNVNGCKDSATQSVTVVVGPVSSFGIVGSSLCSPSLAVSFNNLTSGIGNTYLWSFGDGNFSTAANPSNTYSAISSYDIKLVTTNVGGCKDSITQTISIGSKPTPAFNINNSTQCLSGNLFTFTNTTSGIFTSSFWDFDDGVTSTFTNPTKAFTLAGTYNVKLVVANSNGCKDSISQIVVVVANPVAKFTVAGNTSCSSTLNINFTNTSTGVGNTYLWNFGDGSTSTLTNPGKTYSTGGSYIIRLVATNATGCKDSTERSVTFANKPTAAFAVNVGGVCINNSFTFTNNSVGAVTYLWDFGDGFTSAAINPTKSYLLSGTYTIKLIVTSANGCKDSTSQLVTVFPKPVASFATIGATNCSPNLTLGLNNTSTGVGNTYLWNFGAGANDTSNIFNPTKTFASLGTYTIKLVVSNSNGCKDSTSQLITLSTKPTASFNINNASQCSNNNNFTFTNTSTGSVVSNFWDFGDGFTSSAANPTKSYSLSGIYTVKLVVTNASGCKDSITQLVTLLSNPTAAYIYTGTTACTTNLTLAFTNSSVGAVTYDWSFGDGSTSILSNTSKTYSTAGTYTIKLVATNANGCKDSTTQNVTFSLPPVSSFSVSNASQCLNGNNFSFTNSSTNAISYLWNFGDGTTATLNSPTKIYNAAGVYSIKLFATNVGGCIDSTSTSVTVNAKPTASFTYTGTTACTTNLTLAFTNSSVGAVTYDWSFGDGSTSILSNTSKTYSTAGTYTIKLIATNANGCKDSTTQNVTFSLPPVSSFSVSNASQCLNGNNFSFTNSSTNAISYLWNFGDGTTATLNSPTKIYNAAGVYSIKLFATNVGGCIDSTSTSVTVNAKPTASFTYTGTTACTTNLTLAFTNSSVGAVTYDWSFGDGSTSILSNTSKTYSTAGTYTIKLVATNANGCKDSTTQNVTFSLPPSSSFSVSNASQCLNGNNFSFTNSSTNAISYLWNFGDGTTSTLNSPTKIYNAAGVYTVKLFATNVGGCIDSTSNSVTVNAKPTASFTYTGTTACTTNLTLAFINNTIGSVSNAWDFGDGTTSIVSNPSKAYSTSGTYTIKLVATNANGCKDSTTQSITFSKTPTALFSVNNTIQCLNGNSFAVVNNSINATSYLWNFGDGSTSALNAPSKAYSAAGVYIIKLYANNFGGCIDSTTISVAVNEKPNAVFTYTGATACSNNLTVSFNTTSLGSLSYNWDFGDGTSSTATNPTKTYLTTGTYLVKLVQTNSIGCKDSTTQSITFSLPTTAGFTVNNSTQCLNNNNNFVFTNTSINTVNYLWNFGDGTISTLISPTKTFSVAGVYTVKLFATNVSGCTDSVTTLLTVNAKPTAAFTHSGTTVCNSNLTVSFVSASIATSIYAWSFGDGTTSTSANPTRTYLSSGTYTVKLVETNANGCKDSTTQTIAFTNIPVASFNVVGSAICSSSFGITLNNTSTGNIASYAWSFGDGTTSTLSSPNKLYAIAGNYIIKLIVTSGNGCKDSTSQTVSFSTKPTASFSVPAFDSCSNTFAINLTNTSVNATSYTWTFSDGTTSILTSPTKTFSAIGTYTIKLVATNSNGCKDSTTKTISLLPKPIANFTASASLLCLGNNVLFTNTSTGLTIGSYYWDFGDGTFSLLQNPTKSYITTGTFKVLMFVTNTNGCKDSISKLITITTRAVASFSIPNYNSCSNGGSFSFTNTSTNAVSYLWDFGDGSGSTLQTPTKVYATLGTYTITLIASNAGGCSDTTKQIITLLPKPNVAYTVSSTNGCINTIFKFTDASTGLVATSYYYWDFGDGTFSLLQNPTKAFSTTGNYRVILFVTNANGCKDSTSKVISVISKPTAAFTVPNYSSCSGLNSFNFINTSTNAVNYLWDFGDGSGSTLATPTKTYTANGTYIISLIAINANGCNDSSKQTITLLAKPTASFAVNSTSLCSTSSFVFTNTSTGLTSNSYYWDFGDGTFSLLQNPIKAFSATGNFKVVLSITNANGCKDSTSKIISVITKSVASFTVPDNSICTSNNTITFTNTSTNAVNYLWDFGDGSGSTMVSPTKTYAASGTYTVMLIANNTNGCSDTTRQTISLFPKPIASFVVNNAGQCLNNNSFAFINNSLNGVSFLWNFGDGTFSSLQNPVKTYTTVGTYNVSLTVNNSNGCSDVVTQAISVNPTTAASFNVSGLTSCALGTILTFNNTSAGGGNMPTNYWDFGDGTVSNVYSPTKVYTTPGTYIVKYILFGRFCTDSTSKTITIQPKPTAAFAVSSSANQCLTSNVFSFVNNSSGNIINYLWEFGDGTISTLANPTKSFTTAGNYTIKLTVTNAVGCADITTKTIVVLGKPIITFNINNAVQCLNGNVFTFSNTSPNQSGTLYYWNFGDGILSTLTVINKSYAVAGTYTVTLIGTNASGCTDSLTKTITVVVKPTPNFTASSYSQCANNTISFTNSSTGNIASYLWKFGDGTASTFTNPNHFYPNAGIYIVTLIATNTAGCSDSVKQTILINPKPTAAFTIQGNNQCIGAGSVAFTNISTGILSNYVWDFGDSTGASLANPIKVYKKAGTYNVKLIVVTTNGCIDSITQAVNIIAKPNPSFMFNSISQCINNNSFNFSSVLTGLNSNIYQWDLGDGTTASASSVTKSYSSAGSYNVKLVVINSTFGCRDSVTQLVTVNPQPSATLNGSGNICQGNTFAINTTLVGTPPFSFTYTDGVKNYFVAGINTSLYGLSVSPTKTSTYRILSMSDALCSASTAQLTTTSSVVNVDTTKFIKQPSNIAGCIGNTVSFTTTITSGSAASYQWQKNGVNIIGANASSLPLSNITMADSGIYRLVIVLPCGSIYSTNATLVVNAPAAPPIFISNLKYCQFDSARPLIATGNILNWHTVATGGLSSPNAPTPNTSIVGTQQYWVSNNTIINCESPRYPITVTISPKPSVAFVAVGNTEILPTQTVLLRANASANATGIRWYYNNLQMGSMPLNQTVVGFNALGKYQVEAITAEGCTALSPIINVTGPIGFTPSTAGNNLKLYPNPATSVVNMFFDNPINEDATVRLISATGQILQSKVVKFVNKFQPVQMSIANLRADVYGLEVLNSRGITIARNLLIKAR